MYKPDYLMMTPGPSIVRENVMERRAEFFGNSDLDEDFFLFYDKLAEKTAKIFGCNKKNMIFMSGEGMVGLDSACASLTEPGDRVLVIENGLFGAGFADMVKPYGAVPVTLSFEYEDKKGTTAAGIEKTEFSVKQKVWANLDCDNLPAEVYSTDTVNMRIRVQNVSRTGIFNASVTLEGTGMFPKEEIFLGNMEAGTENTGTMRIFVGTRTMEASGRDEGTDEKEMYGNVTGKITLRYEDGEGKHYEQVKEYETKIQKPRLQTLNIEKPKKANNWWYSVFAAAVCGMVCLIFLLMHRIRKQKILLEEIRQEVSSGKM